MADVRPIEAVHFNLDSIEDLSKVVAPPYDVIDGPHRERLLAQSPYNVVEVDLPVGDNPYKNAGETYRQWLTEGILEREPTPGYWIIRQDYTGPDGNSYSRHGIFARVKAEPFEGGSVRPHERTHAGPKEDRLNLTRATKANLSPIFSLFSDPDGTVTEAVEGATKGEPWATVKDDTDTQNTLWKVEDSDFIELLTTAFQGKELLIADGHHRYETAIAYSNEVGGKGPHNYTLMCLVALEDPGLKVFPTHRVLKGLSDEQLARVNNSIEQSFDANELDNATVPAQNGHLSFGFLSGNGTPRQLTVKSEDILDQQLAGFSDAYRHLNTAVLERLVFEDALSSNQEELAHRGSIEYVKDAGDAEELVRSGQATAAFLLAASPIEQIKAVAAAGENMPPKSTYFYPKLPSGLLFSPLE